MIDDLALFDDLQYGLVKKYVGHNRHPNINSDVFLKLGATFCADNTINFMLVLEDDSEHFITKQYPNDTNSVLAWVEWCEESDEESDDESDDESDEESDEESNLPPAQ